MKDQINLLLYMLDDVRKVTLKGVSGLTKEQLFQEPVPGEYPIGSYLMHNAEVDLFWLSVLKGEDMPEEFKKRLYYDNWYDSSLENPQPPTEPIEVDEYLNCMADARKLVRDYMLSLNDEELEKETVPLKRKNGEKRQLSKKWIIYHLIEHEAHHRGQMFMLIRKAGFKKKGENN